MKSYKTLIIVNPISGTGKQRGIDELLNSYLDRQKYDYDIRKTEYAGHACELANEAIEKCYDVVIAVGGDGTVNEIAKALCGSRVALAIIPSGSGNGLARHIGIPMNHRKAIDWLNRAKVSQMDSVRINDYVSLNVSGVGFDAIVSHLFADMPKRGFVSYVKAILKCFFSYKEDDYCIETDRESICMKGLMLSIANSSQFGNNVYIAPDAKLNDGLVNLCLLRKPRWYQIPMLVLRVFVKRIDHSSLFTEIVCQEAHLKLSCLLGHIDGEPVAVKSDTHIRVVANDLNVLCCS